MALTAFDAVEMNSGMRFDRLYMKLPERVHIMDTSLAGRAAAEYAIAAAPKLSGASSRKIIGVADDDYFGVRWYDNYVWFQEMGINPFVMRNLQGKVVPMWVEDRDGKLRRENPKIKRRTTEDGRNQVLIFRRAARIGDRKQAKRRRGGFDRWVDVPRSYPGAPGRIAKRGQGKPVSNVGGQIMRGNVGVRWRHPGLAAKFFIHEGILRAGRELGFPVGPIYVAKQGEVI